MMKSLLAGALALGLASCSSLGVGGSNQQLTDALMKIATDPTCGHTDELHVALGPVPQGTLDLKRSCGPAATPAPATATPVAK